jgi:hypothetical protein
VVAAAVCWAERSEACAEAGVAGAGVSSPAKRTTSMSQLHHRLRAQEVVAVRRRLPRGRMSSSQVEVTYKIFSGHCLSIWGWIYLHLDGA